MLEVLGRYRCAYNRTLGEYTERPVPTMRAMPPMLRTLGIARRAARARPELMLSDRVGPVAFGPAAWMALDWRNGWSRPHDPRRFDAQPESEPASAEVPIAASLASKTAAV